MSTCKGILLKVHYIFRTVSFQLFTCYTILTNYHLKPFPSLIYLCSFLMLMRMLVRSLSLFACVCFFLIYLSFYVLDKYNSLDVKDRARERAKASPQSVMPISWSSYTSKNRNIKNHYKNYTSESCHTPNKLEYWGIWVFFVLFVQYLVVS